VLRRTGARVVVDQRDLMPEVLASRYERAPRFVSRILRFFERCTQRVANHTITVNGFLANRLVGAGSRPADVTVVRNGPVLARVDAAGPDCTLRRDDAFLVVWVGKMGRQDRVDLVVDVAHHVVHDLARTDCDFVLIGDGECLEELQRRVIDRGLGHTVRFTGWVPEETVFRHLATADLGIDTSLQEEVSPVKAMEYMSFGLPFACFDLLESRRLADGAAEFVPVGDVVALARTVLDLLDHRERRQALGEAGRRRVEEELSWERQSGHYLDVVGAPKGDIIDPG
jgi:glycosyltransferase involved in cell wall biosynthesis